MNVQYSSYLEIDESSTPFRINERFLWSADEGLLFGDEMKVLRDDRTFFTIFEELKNNKPKILRKHETPGFIRKIIDKRRSGTLLLVPLTRELHLTGILAFWEKSDTREWMQAELTTLLVLAGIIETCFSKHRIEEVLEKSEQKFQSLIDQIGDMYFMTDKSGLLIRVSPSMAKNLGFSSVHSLLGTSLENIVHPREFWPVFYLTLLVEKE